MRSLRVVLLAGITLGFGVSAHAHQVKLSTARVTLGGDRTVSVEVALKGSDADRLAGTNVFDAQRDSVDPTLVVSGTDTFTSATVTISGNHSGSRTRAMR